MLQKSVRMLNATSIRHASIRHVLNARSVEHIDVRSARWRAEWARGKLDLAFVRREDSFWRTGDRQACLKRLRQARNNV